MDKKLREILEAPFPESDVRQRKGAFGTVRYVDGALVVARMNTALEAEYNWEVIEYKVLDREILVLGKLTAAGVTRMAFGGSSITRSKETNEVVSLVDDAKAACMDAFKKATSWLGVGLTQLYTDNRRIEQPENGATRVSRPQQPSKNGGNGGNGGASHNGDRLTQAQLSAIWKLGRKCRMNAEDIRAKSTKIFGVVPEFLSKTDASSLISELADELGGAPI